MDRCQTRKLNIKFFSEKNNYLWMKDLPWHLIAWVFKPFTSEEVVCFLQGDIEIALHETSHVCFLNHFITFMGHRVLETICIWAKAGYTRGWVPSSLQGPMWVIMDLGNLLKGSSAILVLSAPGYELRNLCFSAQSSAGPPSIFDGFIPQDKKIINGILYIRWITI